MKQFKFIDLFAGIGGFRLGLESIGGECVFSAEINPHACAIYEMNFGDNPFCDITKLDVCKLPDFDVLCAGFPCQTFSICGQQNGFYDDTRGTLFFDICRILEYKKPKTFILENVANLENHDKGKTLSVIIESLSLLGYVVNYKVLNAKDFGVPQNRERIIILGNTEGYRFDFEKIIKSPVDSMKHFLDKFGDFESLDENSYTIIDNYKKQPKSGLIFIGYRNKKIRKTGVRPRTEHLSRVHKQSNRIYSADGTHPTISSQEQSGRYWIYVDGRVRKLTLNECFKFMGFPSDFKLLGTSAKIYERIGNSICVTMVKAIAKELYAQILKGDKIIMSNDPMQFLETIYLRAVNLNSLDELELQNEETQWIKSIYEHEETFKGVYTVLFTRLTYKCLYPSQDVRYHQANMENGYSGRNFDTKYITPFLKSKQFYGAMKESGWLTRSLEQNLPYNLEYPGKINNKEVKLAFLNILHYIENNNADPMRYLLALIKGSLIEKSKKSVILINPIESESSLSINDIISKLNDHFYFKYKSRGASILPVIALYSVYQCVIEEFDRFRDKNLDLLASHTSSDRSSGATGDIVVRNPNNTLYEVVEVKFEIPIDKTMVQDAYKKISQTPLQRYYILSTKGCIASQHEELQEIISNIRYEHGCQVILNGVIPTLKYYLRLLSNTDNFIEKYLYNLINHNEINYEHRMAWNKAWNNIIK